jgi:hypothetical protein
MLSLPSTPHGYLGAGSRSTPADVLALVHRIAAALARRGWALRSGGAPGADSAFEAGALAAGGRVGLYLPWRGFEGRTEHVVLHEATARAWELAPRFHPGWGRLGRGARALHARNVHQVLGSTCDNPASFVVYWTPDGATSAAETSARTGGTGTAVRIASVHSVPVYNLQREGHRAMWEEFAASSEAIALPR